MIRATAAKSGLRDRIHFTGFVSDQELLQLYGACDIFVYPSFYEGFGLPILEAMACGRAVACSNTSAMPEVADSAALLFDPCSDRRPIPRHARFAAESRIAPRMERLGMQRATIFSWEKAASKTLEVYYEIAGRGKQAFEPVKSISAVLP